MSAEKRKVWVVGHKNPDTDSICAALSYAYLKNQTENDKTYVAKRAGAVNAETHYVLDYFGAQETFVQAVSNPYVVVMALVSLFNAITDPTTRGIGDSTTALTYKNPKE